MYLILAGLIVYAIVRIFNLVIKKKGAKGNE